MSHLTERAIVELRDGVDVHADARAHLDECAACRAALEDAEARSVDIATALTDLDERFDVESARRAVRARLAKGVTSVGRSRGRKAPRSFWTLGRAAAFLLLTTGALSALPGSPVREFIRGRGPPPAPSALAPALSVEPVGIRMIVEDGPVVVELDQVPSGTAIEVRWVAGPAVAVRAAPGSSFSSAEGRVRATIVGGPVTVELPESIDEVSLTVNGRMYLRRSAGSEDVPGPVNERDAERIRFIVP
jgi:hypothetical protein